MMSDCDFMDSTKWSVKVFLDISGRDELLGSIVGFGDYYEEDAFDLIDSLALPIREWIAANRTGNVGGVGMLNSRWTMLFENDEDAIAFKLRWL